MSPKTLIKVSSFDKLNSLIFKSLPFRFVEREILSKSIKSDFKFGKIN